MISLVLAVKKVKEEKQHQFLFDNTVNSSCQYDPSTTGDYYTVSSTKDNNVYTSDRNDITAVS